MSNSPQQTKAWIAFGIAVALLSIIGFAVYRNTVRLSVTERWVSHTREVQATLENLRADMLAAESAHRGYLITGQKELLDDYYLALQNLPGELQQLSALVVDNHDQQERTALLQPQIENHLGVMRDSVVQRERNALTPAQQHSAFLQSKKAAATTTAVLQKMEGEEEHLLEERLEFARRTYRRMLSVLGIAFGMAVLFLFANFYWLNSELGERQRSERAIRTLGVRLLESQDAERRRIARELHDSLGQYLTGAKISLEVGSRPSTSEDKRDALLAECCELLDKAMSETRTLSHLLHPPGLDELGFTAAAQWYVDGFAKRSGIQVALETPPDLGRLPRSVELVLFRIVQESLTNIHRHSGSASAEIRLTKTAKAVTVSVRDYGKGMPPAIQQALISGGNGLGVGLAGMRERVEEMGGSLEVESSTTGTTIFARLPLTAHDPVETATAPLLADDPVTVKEEAADTLREAS
ncbi:MAG TPA: CHASE3 domain-containing protein [Terriglobales bacterium]|nr:CHASE3 domain-containing protein [Terriglobales bacterium]